MVKNQANNKLIAKNAMFLYIRMFVMMGVSLYTSRVVLDILGVSDYGIYNIVGGIVVFFHFFNSTINSTLQRFFNIEMGKGDEKRLHKCFNVGLLIQFILSLCVILLSETVGVYFINNYLNVAVDRMYAVNVVFQISVLTFCTNLMRTPFQALLIASERMGFYAYTSILEALLKLGSVFLLLYISYDKLIAYSMLQAAIAFVVFVLFIYYVRKQFSLKLSFYYSKEIFWQIFSFSGWNVLGSSSALTVSQVINIFLNIFCGVTLNAAAGLASNISGAINQFSANLSMAFSPQIVKLHATNDKDNFRKLVFRSSKASFLLFSLAGLPFICLADWALNVWLIDVPPYAILFAQLCVLDLAIESFSSPLYSSIQASGKVKWYNIGISTIFLINIPLLYLSLKLGFPPYAIFIMKIITDAVNIVFRIIFMSKCVNITASDFVKHVILPCVSLIVILMPIVVLILRSDNSLFQVVLTVFILFPLQLFFSLRLCYDKNERSKMLAIVKNVMCYR